MGAYRRPIKETGQEQSRKSQEQETDREMSLPGLHRRSLSRPVPPVVMLTNACGAVGTSLNVYHCIMVSLQQQIHVMVE